MRVTIYWVTNDLRKREEIRRFFNIPHYVSVNGETTFSISNERFEVLKRGEPKFIRIRHIEKHERNTTK